MSVHTRHGSRRSRFAWAKPPCSRWPIRRCPAICARSTWTWRPCPSSAGAGDADRDGPRGQQPDQPRPERHRGDPGRRDRPIPLPAAGPAVLDRRRRGLVQQYVHLDRLDDHVAGRRARAGGAAGPPFADDPPPSPAYNLVAASGPRLELAGQAPLRSRFISTEVNGRRALECLCTDSEGLAVGGASAVPTRQRGHQPAAHPARGPRSSIWCSPGSARCATSRSPPLRMRPSGRPVPPRTSLSSGRSGEASPRSGWPAFSWPTPVPDSRELGDFRATVDEIVR